VVPVSKGGNLLLNLSPKTDGTIPVEQQKILTEIGDWLAANGEGIYGSDPWKKYGEGPVVDAAPSQANRPPQRAMSGEGVARGAGGGVYTESCRTC
jgi:alpha-L-fucosidase